MHRVHLRLALTAIATAALAACGSGGSDDDPDPAPPPAAARIIGTVATGAALPNAEVAITDAAGADACTEAAVTTAADGTYSCTLADGATAPFLVVVTDPSGGTAPLVAAGSTTPGLDETATINATPLTTAIVGQLAPHDNALAVAADPSLLDIAALDAITAKVLAQLADVLAALEVPAGFDPFTSPLVAATVGTPGDAADQLLDVVHITSVNGQTVMAPFDQPAALVQMADADTATPAAVAAPADTGAGLHVGLARISQVLNACFALPVAERVLAKDDSIALSAGGPAVTEVADACDGTADSETYLLNGYTLGQHFYALLVDEAMVGAEFHPPEVMQYLPDDGGAHRAIVNLRYVDANGTAGNLISVAQRLLQDVPDVAVAGDWVLVGNQQQVDSSIQAFVRRREQLAPDAGSGSGPFGGAAYSRFEAAFNLFVNTTGPGSTGLRAARVKGPGLPPAGVVLTPLDPSICSTQNWMNVRRKDGLADPASATPSGNGGNTFYLQRTAGLTGSDAVTRRSNPFEGGTNNTQFVNWAHPLDYGAAAGSTDYVDFAALHAMVTYTFEYFYEGETAPRHTYDKTLLTPLAPATSAVAQQWVALDEPTRRLLNPADPLAAAATSFDLAWQANPLAQTIRSAGVYSGGPGGAVNQGQVAVVRGATSAVAQAPEGAACAAGGEFPALTDDGESWRSIQLRYRMLDGGYKDSMTQYN